MYESEQRTPFAQPLGRGQLLALDGLAAVGYVLVVLLLPLGFVHAASTGAPKYLLLAGMALPLAVRRLWPRTVFTVVLASSAASLALGTVRDSFVAAAFALYMVALSTPRRNLSPLRRLVPTPAVGVLSAAALLVGGVAGTAAPAGPTVGAIVLGVALLAGAWTLGRAVRERRAYAARSAEQLARQAVTDERLRIARELHDVVAHSMGLIAVKAAVANHIADERPQEVRDALRVIETASRGALTEMRHLLGVLRSEPEPAPERVPAPDLAGLAALADRAAMAGVPVNLEVRGADRLPEGVQLSVFRIVQEALTNVVKHAAPARARVSVVADGCEVAIEVTDDGPGTRVLSRSLGGHGLIGMRERVAMYGGSFTAGPRSGGGFSVSARLPYGPMGDPP